MMKAVFMDYTGTLVQEKGPEIEEAVLRICQRSMVKDPRKVIGLWWAGLKRYEESSYKENYLTEDQIVDRLLADFQREIQLSDDLGELHTLIQRFWVNAPLFPDVKEFFRRCPVPIYVISNNAVRYVEEAMQKNGLAPAGIICADLVRAYKPHREIFEKALEVSGCSGSEAVHIGDSYSADVQGAMAAGIRPVLLQRQGGEGYDGVTCIRSLSEIDGLEGSGQG